MKCHPVLKTMLACCVLMFVATGCILDDDDNSDDGSVTESIGDLTLGGGVFLIPEQGYAFTQIGTFDGADPYLEAEVYVNGVFLSHQGGMHTNTSPLSMSLFSDRDTVTISVYALGDSVVTTVPIPETPVIVKPQKGYKPQRGQDLQVEIEYPGDHDYRALSLTNQDDIVYGDESQDDTLGLIIHGYKLPNAGESLLSAYSVIASGDIPDEFDLMNQYRIFLAAAITLRELEFTQ